MNRAVFFDKDGVLNPDRGVAGNLASVEVYADAPRVIARCREAGYLIFVVTNQPAVARGVVTEDALRGHLERFGSHLRALDPGAVIDRILYCPHHPNANVTAYRVSCECRKPRPGMIHAAASEYDVDLACSVLVGDRISDVIAGYLAGCGTTVQVLSGQHDAPMIETDLILTTVVAPDRLIAELGELMGLIA